MLSTLEDGKVVKGLAGIPLEGPVLLVGNHMLGALDLIPLIAQFFIERNILVRGIGHPMNFVNKDSILRERGTPSPLDLLIPEPAAFDANRITGSIPVSGPILYKVLSSKSHVLLYPGGFREAMHRKVRFHVIIAKWRNQHDLWKGLTKAL